MFDSTQAHETYLLKELNPPDDTVKMTMFFAAAGALPFEETELGEGEGEGQESEEIGGERRKKARTMEL